MFYTILPTKKKFEQGFFEFLTMITPYSGDLYKSIVVLLG